MGELIIQQSGLYTSIQDLGRLGWRKYGVPISGAMDQYSFKLSNLLVGNPENTAALEITLQGPSIAFTDQAWIALTGAHLSAKLNRHTAPLNQPFSVKAGDVLHFGAPVYGVRSYLAVHGGFQSEKILGSYSQYTGITSKSRLKSGDQISYGPQEMHEPSMSLVKPESGHFDTIELEVTAGPEFSQLTPLSESVLLDQSWLIGSNNRMGYRLSQPLMPGNQLEIITSQVIPGMVQLTPSAELLVLMSDAQVTGGYPRILQLTDRSINQLAQKKAGDHIQFILTFQS